jgi:hypothetical protein
MKVESRTMAAKILFTMITILLLLISSCDMGSYNPIARALDPFEAMGENSKAWMDVTGSLGDSSASLIILQEGAPVNRDQGGYVYIEIVDKEVPSAKTDIVLTRGLYEVNNSGGNTLILRPSAEYRGSYVQTSSPSNNPAPLDREGEVATVSYAYNAGNRELNLGSPGSIYSPLQGSGGVLDSLYGKTNDVRAAQLMLVYQIGLYASQVIVPGFGGPGMMTFYNNQTPFNGLVQGNDLILMSSLLPTARVDFDYQAMENIPGLSMSGLQRTDSNAKGNGSISETVTTTLTDNVRPDYIFSVAYNGVNITGTVPTSGAYIVSVEGVPETISFDNVNPGKLNFPGILAP